MILHADFDEIMLRAYSQMKLSENQSWTKYSEYEVKQIIKWANLPKGSSVLDIGCGIGRHSHNFGKLGYFVTGIDIVDKFIVIADYKENHLVEFFQADARTLNLSKKDYDLVICVYDVIGSFIHNTSNQMALNTAVSHLCSGAHMFISVMSYEYTVQNAKYTFKYASEPDKISQLPITRNMEITGNAFDPNTYIVDTDTHIVYRKEMFGEQTVLPVADRRFTVKEISEMCNIAGLDVCWTKNVRAGNWDIDLGEGKSKEILLMCKKK